MAPEVIGILIPIVFLIIFGIILVALIDYQSKEKQLMIEKGLNPEELSQLLNSKKKTNTYSTLKIGIITIFFGLGLGLGIMIHDNTGANYAVPLLLFTLTGLGFIIAFFTVYKLEKREKQNLN